MKFQNLATMISLFALLCSCPPAAEPSDISQLTCPEDFGQIQKAILQRTYSTGTTLNTIPIASVTLEATWQALVDAADSTKAQWTPTLGEPVVTPGAPLEFGSGNQVPDGAAINRGSDPTVAAFTLYSWTQVIVAQLKTWKCEEASVFFINQDGQIAGLVDNTTTPTTFRGFPIINNTMHVGDKQPGGHGEPDRNAWNFKLRPNWSDNWYVVTPASTWSALNGLY